MKKITLILGILMAVVLIYNNKEEYLIIPNEAIRVRVIANSYNENDIEIKEKVKDDLNNYVYKMLDNPKNISEARKIINNNLDNINNYVDKSLNKLNYNKKYNINFGMNYFPEKEFNGVKYNEGYYESLVVTLGDGNGPNYWCVLYPPLCLIDNKDNKEIEYKSYIKELLNKYI